MPSLATSTEAVGVGGDDGARPPPPSKCTRICIKNVPPRTSAERLRKHLLAAFSPDAPGAGGGAAPPIVITDCRILKTKTGASRKLAFVGFQSPGMATGCVEYLDGTYVGTSRISVEYAEGRRTGSMRGDDGEGDGGGGGDKDGNDAEGKEEKKKDRPWSKYSEGSSRHAKLHRRREEKEEVMGEKAEKKKKKTIEVVEKGAQKMKDRDKRREEFLSVMAPRGSAGRAKFWSNDDDGDGKANGGGKEGAAGAAGTDDGKKKERVGQDGDAIVAGGVDRGGSHGDDDGSGDDTDSSSSSTSSRDDEDDNPRTKQTAKVVSDMEFLRSKASTKENLSEDDEEGDDGSSSSCSSSSSSSSSSDDDISTSSSSSLSSVASRSGGENIDGDQGDGDDGSQREVHPGHKDNGGDVDERRLFVRNLPYLATEDEVRAAFDRFGTVTECRVPTVDDDGTVGDGGGLDRDRAGRRRNKGFAFVAFDSAGSASEAAAGLDGSDFQGRLMHVLPGRRPPPPPTADGGGGRGNDEGGSAPSLTYKQRMELERRREAGDASRGWSASHLRGEAVVDAIAERLGLTSSKDEVLRVTTGSSGDAAVRLALGEAHVVNENREYFRRHGVDLDALVGAVGVGDAVKRSRTRILVKNLPYSTTREELLQLFGSSGGTESGPSDVLLPPSRAIALVEYDRGADAKKTFRRLAYRRFKDVPLYLEWAPLAAASAEKKVVGGDDSAAAVDEGSQPTKQDVNLPATDGNEDEDEDANAASDPGVVHTVFVKNLNFSTTESDLRSVFEQVVPVVAVKIPTKREAVKLQSKGGGSAAKDGATSSGGMSMGFGFVECKDAHAAKKAMRALRGKIVDGHAWDLKMSHSNGSSSAVTCSVNKKKSAVDGPFGKKRVKLMVRNVPFQASRTELLKLFGSYGQLKKVRLPKKFDGTHRGFAFVEYLSSQEAQSAMDSLSRTHLYGRHLVLEWAEDSDDLGTLHEKARRDVELACHGLSTARNKKMRFSDG